MPKRVFWPVALVILGIILLATSVGMLPKSFLNLWPLVLIIVGLGGLLISDKEDWDTAQPTRRAAVSKPAAKKVVNSAPAPTKKAARAKSRKR